MKELNKSMDKLSPLFEAINNTLLQDKMIAMYNDLDNPRNSLHNDSSNNALISDAPAGKKHHHPNEGGLMKHMVEMWELAETLYDYATGYENEFNKSDIAVGILLHDLSKAIAYKFTKKGNAAFEYRPNFFKKMTFDNRTFWLMAKYNIDVTENVFNAVMFAEGGWSDAAKNKLEHGALGGLLHICDMYSSQIYYKLNLSKQNCLIKAA